MKHKQQRGATLIIALVLLLALTLMGLWGFNLSTSNLRVVGNTQARAEALSAAQAALERTISSPLFTTQPQAVAASTIDIDMTGDGQADYTARVSPAPACYKLRSVKNSELDPGRSADLACMRSSASQHAGIDNGGIEDSGNSLCADSEWDLRVEVADASTGARVAIHQGVALRGLVTDATNSCP